MSWLRDGLGLIRSVDDLEPLARSADGTDGADPSLQTLILHVRLGLISSMGELEPLARSAAGTDGVRCPADVWLAGSLCMAVTWHCTHAACMLASALQMWARRRTNGVS